MRFDYRLLAALSLLSCTQSPSTPAPAGPATTPDISAASLRARLSILADDSMEGREAGTRGNVKATEYISAQARRIGLKPAGDSGGWFQTVPFLVRQISKSSGLEIDDTAYSPWKDFLPRDQGKGARSVNGVAVIFGGVLGDSSRSLITAENAAGKLVLLGAARQANGTATGTVNRPATTALFPTAAGIAVATLDAIPPSEQADLRAGVAALTVPESTPTPSFFYVTSKLATSMLNEPVAQAQPGDVGKVVRGDVVFVQASPSFPARNVVALLPGSDPALKGEMVAVGAHSDHIGITRIAVEHDSIRAFNRVMLTQGANGIAGVPTPEQKREIDAILDSLRKTRAARRDSISNGADDDGSGAVGVLAIAEALAHGRHRPKRSVLFVWHTGEEKNLVGSDWFTQHPTVPRDSIVAQLNIDMIGRGGASDLAGGGPGYLQVIGSRRLSTELGDLIEQVNREGKHGFQFDYRYDANGHPDDYYCRSDHYMYARFGIPVAFFTTGAHEDYHQVTDEVQYIDFDKMARVVGLVEASTIAVANLDHPVVVDKPKPDPKAPCKQ